MSRTKKIISLLLLVIFVSYYAGATLFFHTHTDESGRLFTHSHPYTSGTHTHSANAIQFINNLSNLFFIGSGVLFVPSLFSVSKMLLYIFYKQHTVSLVIKGNPLRAPPILA